jgi:hypothetical protein
MLHKAEYLKQEALNVLDSKAEAMLKKNLERFDSLVDTLNESIKSMSANGGFIYYSPNLQCKVLADSISMYYEEMGYRTNVKENFMGYTVVISWV